MISMICEDELKMFESYIDEYVEGTRTVGVGHILRVWQREKSKYLDRIFKDSLIISKPISVVRGQEELIDDMCRSVVDNFEFYELFHHLRGLACRFFKEETYDYDSYYNMISLWESDTLTENKVLFDTLSIPLPNDKILRVNKGDKPVKVIGKLFKAYNLGEKIGISNLFEKFRIAHSQVLNQKKLNGELCLSIHPLDYATMSDNTCGWNSCMSWEDNGCYRQGTVEMMNSPMVVVAYLLSKDDMDMPGGGCWNSKKWRELFIVNEVVISEIKSYPYFNEELTRVTLDWLKELAESANIGTYGDIYTYDVEDYHRIQNENRTEIRFDTNFMYNDFRFRHLLRLNINVNKDYYEFNYSGPSQCMLCGEETESFVSEESLCCRYCNANAVDCYECGCMIDLDNDDYYEVNGVYYCPDCYHTLFKEDGFTGNAISVNEVEEIAVVLTFEGKEYIWTENIFCFDPNGYYDYWLSKVPEFNESENIYTIHYEDLTRAGKNIFGLYNPDENEDNIFWRWNSYKNTLGILELCLRQSKLSSKPLRRVSARKFTEFIPNKETEN